MTEPIEQAAAILSKCRSAIALTGAGISVESGIPHFRGKGGLWEKIDPVKYAHIDAYERNPQKVWQVLFMDLKTVLEKAKPNPGHLGLRRLEEHGILQTIITQNIDGLHQQAGSGDVIEFHGTFASLSCMSCAMKVDSARVALDTLPPRCACGGVLRPDVVMFGEIIPIDAFKRSQILASDCDAMLVVGTSATVQPAAYLPAIAKRSGAAVIEINAEPTPLTGDISDITLIGKAGRIMRDLVAAVERVK